MCAAAAVAEWLICIREFISGTTSVPSVQCSSNEDPTTLNYADSLAGTSELIVWVLLPDGSTFDKDVKPALHGSGSFLQLPSSGSANKPIRLLIRRSLEASTWEMTFASIDFIHIYGSRVEVEVYDKLGQVAASYAVSGLLIS